MKKTAKRTRARRPVRIDALTPGTRFNLSDRVEGTLLRVGPGSAYVELERPSERTFIPKTGPNAGREVSFGYATERGSWSLSTLVIPLTGSGSR